MRVDRKKKNNKTLKKRIGVYTYTQTTKFDKIKSMFTVGREIEIQKGENRVSMIFHPLS